MRRSSWASLVVVHLTVILGCSNQTPAAPSRVRSPRPAAGASKASDPFGLTSSDGEGLSFVRLDVAGFVQRPLAYTELRMTFENPSDRVKEGRFEITLPPGGSVARFAMRSGDQWQEGEMVELRTAQRAYDDFLHRRQDPALLEHEAGNEFSARVFPIPARGRKELILSYSQEMRSDEPYRVPLRGLPGLGEYRARIVVNEGGKQRVVEAAQSGWVPDADMTVAPPAQMDAAALRSGRLTVARITVPGDTTPEEIGSLAVLIDTSASRATGFDHQVELVTSLMGALSPQTPVLVAGFDQDADVVFEGEARSFDPKSLVARRALGATDLDHALLWLGERLGKKSYGRALIIGDGVVTAGEEGAALTQAAAGLAKAGVQRLDAIALGGIRDDAALARLARAGFAHEGMVISGDSPLPEMMRRLRTQARSGLKVEFGGGQWVEPAVLNGVQPGDEVLLHGDAPEDQPLRVLLDGKPLVSPSSISAEGPLVLRSCAAAKISFLQDQLAAVVANDSDRKLALNAEMITLSTTYRVSSPLTAFLVLESDGDYARYGIDRTKAGNIWAVGTSGLVSVKRGELDEASRNELAEEQAAQRAAASAQAEAAKRVPKGVDLDSLPDRFARVATPEKAEEKQAPVATAAQKKGLLKLLGSSGPADSNGEQIQDTLGAGRAAGNLDEAVAGAPGVAANAPAAEPAPAPAPMLELASPKPMAMPKAKHAASPASNLSASDRQAIHNIQSIRPGSEVDRLLGGGGSIGEAGPGLGSLGSSVGSSAAHLSTRAVQGAVTDAAPEVGGSGEIDRDALQHFVKVRLRSLRACYERELLRNPSLQGQIVTRFTIGQNGRVKDASVATNTLGSEEVARCVTTTIRAWTTPFHPSSDVAVSYPFVFVTDVTPGTSPSLVQPQPLAPPTPVTPDVTLSVTTLDGPISRDALARELAAANESLLPCFQAVDWGKSASPPPSFEVRVGISPLGKIDRAGFSPSEPATLTQCLSTQLQSLGLKERPLEESAATLQLAYSGGAWVDYRIPDGRSGASPWTGRFDEVMKLIRSGQPAQAFQKAYAWHEEAPGDVLALVALGEGCEATGDRVRAARAYGSIIDLYPSRADLRRFAGNRLERLGAEGRADELATDTYRHAVEQRPDHPSSHHLLGMALLRAGHPEQAFAAFATGYARSYPPGRFAGATRILAEDIGLAASAWKKSEPARAAEIDRKLLEAHGSAESAPSVRFVLSWETDDNDVDFHIHDRFGGHAFYSSRTLPSGGELYADVTTGYGPECFTIRGPAAARAYPYWLDAHYYSRGPMGYGMGQIEVIDHDGQGGMTWESRPFVVMQDQAFVDEGKVVSPLGSGAHPK